MKKILQYVLAGLLALTPAAWAIQLSDVSPDLTRTAADENLTKDYAYRVLSDLSVRRIWNLDDNRKLTIDFDPRKDSLICIVVDYRKPVSLEEADRDAADIGKFENASWRKFDKNKAAKYFMGRSRAMKFEQGYMFQELNGANKCSRLSFFTKQPKENRRLISEGSTSASGSTAMGNSGGGNAIKTLLADEEKRLFTANKTDKPKTTYKPTVIEPEEDEEPVEEPSEDFTTEDVEPEEVVDTPTEVVKGPVEVKPIKPVKKKGDRKKDVDGLMAKLGLDKLEPIHWILGVVGLVILITIISVVGRSNERRKIEARAARLRNSGNLQDSLRAGMQGKKRSSR